MLDVTFPRDGEYSRSLLVHPSGRTAVGDLRGGEACPSVIVVSSSHWSRVRFGPCRKLSVLSRVCALVVYDFNNTSLLGAGFRISATYGMQSNI